MFKQLLKSLNSKMIADQHQQHPIESFLIIRMNAVMFTVYIGPLNSLKDKDLIDKQCCLIMPKITMMAAVIFGGSFVLILQL